MLTRAVHLTKQQPHNNNINNIINIKTYQHQHNHYNNKLTPSKKTNPLLLCGFVLGYLVVVVLCVDVDMF
jgi:hypothetical protein